MHPGTLTRASHPPRQASPTWARWTIWIYVVVGLAALAALSVAAHTTAYFPFDPATEQSVQAALPAPVGHDVLDPVSWIGFPPEVDVVFGVIIVSFLLVGYRWEGISLLFAGVLGASSWFLVALPVHRPRPSPSLVHVEQMLPIGSYPSGHVLNLTAFFGSLFFICWVALPHRWYRVAALCVSAALVLVIGLARVYSGEHWPSDVLGGYLQGSVVLALTVLLYRWRAPQWGRHHGRPPAKPIGPASLHGPGGGSSEQSSIQPHR